MDLVPLLGYIYIVALVIGLMLLFLRKIPRTAPPEPFLKLIDTFRPMIVSGLMAAGAFFAVIWLAKKAACNLRPEGSPRYYEPFQTETTKTTTESYKPPPGSSPSDYIPYVNKAIDRLEKTLDAMTEATSDVCGIVKEIESAYVATKGGDVDESEFSLPRDEQDARRKQRKARAEKLFATNRNLFAKKANTTVLECFQEDVGDDEAESELQTVAQELQTLLEDPDVQGQVRAFLPAVNALNFSSKYLDKADSIEEEGFQGSPTPSPVTPPVSSLTGKALLAAVDDLLRQEAQFNMQAIMLKNMSSVVDARIKEKYRKAERAQRGDVSSADVQSELSARNVSAPK
jgi:hypothetical protein